MTQPYAELHLEFEAARQATTFRCLRQDPPWKVVRGFPMKAGGCLVHLNNVSGGIFGGDRLRLTATLHRDAHAQLTTTGATRVYRPRQNAEEALLSTHFHLAAGAKLEYVPDPLIPFREARVFQQTSYSLEEGATLFGWDTLAPGRTAMGERFQYERLKIATQITVTGKPCLTDRLLLEPRCGAINTPARMAANSYLVTFFAVQAGMSAAAARELEQTLLQVLSSATEQTLQQNYWGVTTLVAHGVVVRGAVHSGTEISATLNALWRAAKWQLCQQPSEQPRKTY